MNILQLITHDDNRSGIGVQMMQLSFELARLGHSVTAVYKANPDRDDDFKSYMNSGINLRRVDLKHTDVKFYSLADIRKIRALISAGNYDIIHSHSNAVDHAFLASLGTNIPVVANRGMSSPLKWKNALKYKFKRIAHIIAVSENVKDVMCQTGGIPEEKISVIYGSVDTNRFRLGIDSHRVRAQLGINEHTFVVGYTGSIGGRKGIDYLIESFRELTKIHPNMVLLLVGINEKQLEEHQILLGPDLKSKVKCMGFQHQSEQMMAAFDLFVFPGTKSEGLTGAIREAAAMGIPVVTTDVGGNKELIVDGERGIVVQSKSIFALIKGMNQAICEYDTAKDRAKRAYAFVHDNMTLQIRTQKVLSLYQRIMTNQKGHTKLSGSSKIKTN